MKKRKTIIITLIICILIVLIIVMSNIGINYYNDNHSKISSDDECCACYDCPECDMCCSCDNTIEKIIKGLRFMMQ